MSADAPVERLLRLLGIRRPVVLAGMAGGPTTPELVAAVSEAGGLGTFGLAGMTADAARAAVEAACRLTTAPVAVNVLLAPPTPPAPGARDPREALAPLREELGAAPVPPAPPPASPLELARAGLEGGARVLSAGLGDPAPLVELARQAGVPVLAMVTTSEEARRAVDSGADAIVAQGAEAGGHRSTFPLPDDGSLPLVGTLALVPQVVRAVDVPVLAAGGVMDGAGLAAVLALGAAGAQLGTRFLTARESGVPPSYRARIAAARETDAVITRAISGRPARGLRNRLMELLEAEGPPALGYPRQAQAHADVRAAALRADRADGLALWAGQAAGLAGEPLPAAEIVAAVIEEARRAVDRVGAALVGLPDAPAERAGGS